jgi:hypothetical protein
MDFIWFEINSGKVFSLRIYTVDFFFFVCWHDTSNYYLYLSFFFFFIRQVFLYLSFQVRFVDQFSREKKKNELSDQTIV